MRIRIVWEGKTRNPHLRALADDYAERIRPFSELVIQELDISRSGAKDSARRAAEKRLQKSRAAGGVEVVLDPRGREWTSEELAEWFGQQALRGTRELAFYVGGPDGVSGEVRSGADLLLSLSRLTLTTDWARVLLLEQIYRAFTILRGFPYSR